MNPIRIIGISQRTPARIVLGAGWLIPEGPHAVMGVPVFFADLSDGRTVRLSRRRADVVRRALIA